MALTFAFVLRAGSIALAQAAEDAPAERTFAAAGRQLAPARTTISQNGCEILMTITIIRAGVVSAQ
ncbi:hypothetical protein AOA59_29940 [Pseudomonas sp. 2822-15]|nr:hypothetical protein AOA59_29940 [Pseudomonas sp. 2822-15]